MLPGPLIYTELILHIFSLYLNVSFSVKPSLTFLSQFKTGNPTSNLLPHLLLCISSFDISLFNMSYLFFVFFDLLIICLLY